MSKSVYVGSYLELFYDVVHILPLRALEIELSEIQKVPEKKVLRIGLPGGQKLSCACTSVLQAIIRPYLPYGSKIQKIRDRFN